MNAGYFLIQLASERDNKRDEDPVYQSIGKYLRADANGVAQMAYIRGNQDGRGEAQRQLSSLYRNGLIAPLSGRAASRWAAR